MKGISFSDRLALLLSLLAVVAGWLVTDRIYESMPHIEDEMAYTWQAQAIAGGHLTLPSPPQAKSFLVPFVVDYNGYIRSELDKRDGLLLYTVDLDLLTAHRENGIYGMHHRRPEVYGPLCSPVGQIHPQDAHLPWRNLQ